jgi:hypothetical protein
MGGPPAWGLGVGLTTPHRKKISLLREFLAKRVLNTTVLTLHVNTGI